MATAKKKTAKKASPKKAASKSAASKKPAAPAKAPTRASTKKSATAKPAAATKVPKKKAPKKAAAKKPSLTRTVNMGPERGDNSFPPGNKPAVFDHSRTVRTSPAHDSTSGPGGKAAEGRAKDKKTKAG